MKIPKVISKNNNEYIIVKEYENYVLYENLFTGAKECFSRHELGLITETTKPNRKVQPENVSYL